MWINMSNHNIDLCVTINITYFALQWMKSQSSSHTCYKSMEWRMSPKFTPQAPKYMKEGWMNHPPLSSNLVHIIIHWFQVNNIFCHLLVIQNIYPFHGRTFRLFGIFFPQILLVYPKWDQKNWILFMLNLNQLTNHIWVKSKSLVKEILNICKCLLCGYGNFLRCFVLVLVQWAQYSNN
jgi:hypothetical protein